MASSCRFAFVIAAAFLCSCMLERAGTARPDAGAADGGADAGRMDSGGGDAGPGPDAGPGVDSGADSGSDEDSGPGSDAGLDAGPCPSGETGTTTCPFTSLAAIATTSTGSYHFAFGAERFESRVDSGGGGGWMLVASADDRLRGSNTLTRTRTGPLALRTQAILGPEVISAIPDLGEVRINSSPGSVIVTSVESRDSYVLGELFSYRSLYRQVSGGEAGTLRWTGDTARVSTTCAGSSPGPLDGRIFQACGTAALHWAPAETDDRANRWHFGDGNGERDRLNLWVRD